jgi:hypothetical protein
MSSVIHWAVDETNFRFGLFLVSQAITVGALAAVAVRFASGISLDPARK